MPNKHKFQQKRKKNKRKNTKGIKQISFDPIGKGVIGETSSSTSIKQNKASTNKFYHQTDKKVEVLVYKKPVKTTPVWIRKEIVDVFGSMDAYDFSSFSKIVNSSKNL